MTELTQGALAAVLARLLAALPTIRKAIRRHSESCWAEHLSTITLRFHSNNSLAQDVEELRKVVDHLICYAGKRDALECLRVLHDRDCSFVHVRTPGGGSLLHATALSASERTLSWLLDTQALPVNEQGRAGATALHIACTRGHAEIVRLLLARHAFIDAPDNSGETPLHAAVRAGWDEISQTLIEAGANLGATSRYGATALSMAVERAWQSSDWKLVTLLLDRGAALTRALPSLLRLAPEAITRHARISVARLDACEQDQLCRLFETACPAQAQELLERGADPTTASVHALRNAQYDLFPVIRAQHSFHYTSAHYHAALESLHGLTRLLDHGGDPNAIIENRYGDERHRLIHFAARGVGDIATVSVLLKQGAPTSAAPELLEDPLLVVLVRHERASPEVISAYAEQGHDINVRTSSERTALHVLASQPWSDRVGRTLHALLGAGADVEARDLHGCTPLLVYIRSFGMWSGATTAGIAAWLDAGASIKATDCNGSSVLHHFFGPMTGSEHSGPNHHAVLELLLNRGADIDATTSSGLYPEEFGDQKIFFDLRESVRRLRRRRTLAATPRHEQAAGRARSQPPHNAVTAEQQHSRATVRQMMRPRWLSR